jgi:hypothetical protein
MIVKTNFTEGNTLALGIFYKRFNIGKGVIKGDIKLLRIGGVNTEGGIHIPIAARLLYREAAGGRGGADVYDAVYLGRKESADKVIDAPIIFVTLESLVIIMCVRVKVFH